MRVTEFYQEALGVKKAETAARLAAISRLETIQKGKRIISMGEHMEMLPVLVKGALRG